MKKIFINLILILPLLACSSRPALITEESFSPIRPRIQFDNVAFENERAAWDAQGITNYTFEGLYNWLDMARGNITVTDGKITNIVSRNSVPEDGWRTISGIYEWIYERYEYALSTIEAMAEDQYYYILVRYNPQYHYPEYASMGVRSYDFPLEGYFPSYIVMNFLPSE
jgi:hypothetical protein